MPTNEELISFAQAHLCNPTDGHVEQYMKVHQIETDKDGNYIAEHIEYLESKDEATIYFKVVEESFFITVYLDINPKLNFRSIHSTPKNTLYFSATSETLTFDELQSFTTIKGVGWTKGEPRRTKTLYHTFSRFSIKPEFKPGEFEDILDKLLDILESDKKGIKEISHQADTSYIMLYCAAHIDSYGGPNMSKEQIKRMADLGLSFQTDLYIEGNPFIS